MAPWPSSSSKNRPCFSFRNWRRYSEESIGVRTGFKGAQEARAPGLPPTGGLPPNSSYFVFVRDMCVSCICIVIFRLLVSHLVTQSELGPGPPHQLNPALIGVQSGRQKSEDWMMTVRGAWSEYDATPAVFLWIVGRVDGSFVAVHPEPSVDVRPAVQTLGDGDHAQLLTLQVHHHHHHNHTRDEILSCTVAPPHHWPPIHSVISTLYKFLIAVKLHQTIDISKKISGQSRRSPFWQGRRPSPHTTS